MSVSPTLSILYSELVLSLYPILIKAVQTNTFTQILARFLVFPVLAIVFGSTNDFRLIWGDPYEAFVSILNNVFNLCHVAVSYLSFKELPAGTAISLFYLYPVFNIIAGALLWNEGISLFSIFVIMLAFCGVYFISTSHKETDPKKKKKYHFGVLMGILAALTETMIFVFVRSNTDAQKSPFYTVNHLYPAGLVGLLGYSLMNRQVVDTSPSNWMKLLGFNAVLGFTGYIARFYAIPRIPTIVFSVLSFIGVTFGYLWGILFTNDDISLKGLIGSGLIAGSIGILRYFGMTPI